MLSLERQRERWLENSRTCRWNNCAVNLFLRGDIYSLGGTIYFLLTGRDPTPLEPSQVKSGTDLPTNLNALLAKCTALEVADRYRSSEELLTAIRKIRTERRVSLAEVNVQAQ